ncbi:MAG TPA: hypothetical protein VFQ88_06155 [Nevskiaceae bacterium]|nr:hypothetical protein [Nevskiaceae bacterium]
MTHTEVGASTTTHRGERSSKWLKWAKRGSLAVAAAAVMGFAQSAMALPNFSIIAPNEFIRLPMVKKPVWFYFQTGIYDHINSAFGAHGGTTPEGVGTVYAGLSRFGQIEPSINLGGVEMGWAWEYLQPYSEFNLSSDSILTGAANSSTTGLGDPIVLLGEYFRPNFKAMGREFDTTIGFWPVLSMPFGNNNTALSNHAWVFFPTIIGDVSTGPVGLNFTIGAKISGDADIPSNADKLRYGNQYFIQSDLHFRATKWLGLAIMNFYNISEASNYVNKSGGVVSAAEAGADEVELLGHQIGSVFNTGCVAAGEGCVEDLIGPSATVYFSPMTWISAWYYTPLGFVGHNTFKDKAVMFRFVHLWMF